MAFSQTVAIEMASASDDAGPAARGLSGALPARPRATADPAMGSPDPAPGHVVCREGEQLTGPAARVAEARLALLRAEYARLVTAARASVTAARAGAADPLVYVEAELARHCGLPPQDSTVPAVLADAGAAMALAARAARRRQADHCAWSASPPVRRADEHRPAVQEADGTTVTLSQLPYDGPVPPRAERALVRRAVSRFPEEGME